MALLVSNYVCDTLLCPRLIKRRGISQFFSFFYFFMRTRSYLLRPKLKIAVVQMWLCSQLTLASSQSHLLIKFGLVWHLSLPTLVFRNSQGSLVSMDTARSLLLSSASERHSALSPPCHCPPQGLCWWPLCISSAALQSGQKGKGPGGAWPSSHSV